MRFLDLERRSSFIYLVFALLTLAALLVYVIVAGVPSDRKLVLVLALIPPFLASLALQDAPRIMLALLTLSLSFSARYRLPGSAFHPGGAELSIAPMDFPLLGLLLLALPELSRSFWRKVRAQLWPLTWALLFFIAVHLASVGVAADRGLAALETLRLLKMVLLIVILTWYVRSREDALFVLKLLLIATVAQGLMATLQWLFKASFGLGFLGEHDFWAMSYDSASVGRAGGTLGHANALAYFLEMLTPIALAYALTRSPQHLGRILAPVAVLAGVTGTFLTFSRAGWAALALGLVSVLVLQVRRRWVSFARILPLLLVFVVIVGLVGGLTGNLVALRLGDIKETSAKFRELLARTALNMLRARPILGVGANNYVAVSPAYVSPDLSGKAAELSTSVVHNIILLYGAELGIAGIAALLALLISVARLGWRLIQSNDSSLATAAIGITAGMLAMFAHAQLDWLFRYDPIFTLFWFLVGLLLAMHYTFGQSERSCKE